MLGRASRALALVVLAALVMSPPVGGAPPPSGDWIVVGHEAVESRTITLDGNLVVRGNLTLRQVDLTFTRSAEGRRGISVEPGGSLTVIDGSIGPADPESRIRFVAKGDALLLDGTNVSGVGSCTTHAIECVNDARDHGGIVVGTPGATLRDSHIRRGGVGLILRSDDVRLTGNLVEDNDRCAVYLTGNRATIEANVLRQSYRGFVDRSCVLQMDGSDNVTIVGNDLREDPFPPGVETVPDPQGINTFGSSGLLIANNTIAAYRPVHLFQTSNTRILGNTIHAGEVGVFLQGGANNRVEGNTILGDGWAGGTGPTNVLALSIQHGSVVADNRIVMHRGLGYDVIVLNQFFDGLVLNNEIESSFDAYDEDPEATEGGEAMILVHSSGNEIRGNRLGLAWGGLFLLGSDANLVEGNEIQGLRGVTAVASKGNTIVGNNILDRPRGSYDDGANLWSRGSEGNHWIADRGAEAPRAIPPLGIDAAPRPEPVEIRRWPVPAYAPLSDDVAPIPAGSAILETTLLEDRVMDVTHGTIRPPYGESRLTIRNSTLVLGRLGPVQIGAEDLVIEDSHLVFAPAGYGFGFGAYGDRFVVRNSVIDGGGWGDPAPREFILENSTVSRTVAIGIFSSSRPIERVRIVNNTFEGILIPLYVGAVDSANVSGNRFTGSVHTAILVNDVPALHRERMREIVVSDNEVQSVWKAPAIVVGYGGIELERAEVARNHVRDSWIGLNGGGPGLVLSLNSFCQNREAQAVGGPGTSWHNAGRGNHWSDYRGQDADGDGIGDTPYVAGGLVDPFPLMRPATRGACGSPAAPAADDPAPRSTESAPPARGPDPTGPEAGAQPTPGAGLANALLAILLLSAALRPRTRPR